MEITSWGWNPYPYGIYSQGPFNGTGTFQHIPKETITGTCLWEVIWRCKADNVSDEEIWAEIVNHELVQLPGFLNFALRRLLMGKGYDATPKVIKQKLDGSWIWDTLADDNGGGWIPLLISYHCFIYGGFGGIGDKWYGNDGPFGKSWKKSDSEWGPGRQYAPVLKEVKINGKKSLIMPVDQSVPEEANLDVVRDSEHMWKCFRHMFMDYIIQWDINWVREMWRFPIFKGTPDETIGDYNFRPSAFNPSDDFMMAMATGNFDIVKYSPTGFSDRSSHLSKFSNNPMTWSHKQTPSGKIVASSKVKGFPTGRLIHKGSGYTFVIRTQMPNVNGDLCAEFADFRVTTPGRLDDGSGDQELWKELMKFYGLNYIFSADPFDKNNSHSFTGEYEGDLPETKPIAVKPTNDNWMWDHNILTDKVFYGYDVLSGIWSSSLSYTGKSGHKYVSMPQLPCKLENGSIVLCEPEHENNKRKLKRFVDQCKHIVPKPMPELSSTPGDKISSLLGITASVPSDALGFTTAPKGTKYYPFATDSFVTGDVGIQGKGRYAHIGSCQTRWGLNSNKIPWKFSSPASNRSILLNGVRDLKNKEKLTLQKRNTPSAQERKNLETYLALVYPMVRFERWKNMSLKSLRKFYCSLHYWYKGKGLPSPNDYLRTDEWKASPPLGKDSSWKNFTTRKHSIIGAPRAKNETDNKVVVGYDKQVGTTSDETPCGILWRGRQLASQAAGPQQATFFQPAGNLWIDNHNVHGPTVNDPDIEAWQRVKHIEVCSSWGPCPHGAYLKWSPGTGTFYKLGRKAIGYTGLDLLRVLGEELISKCEQPKMFEKLKGAYYQQWESTGLENMKVRRNGRIYDQAHSGDHGSFNNMILTKAQWDQINDARRGAMWETKGKNFCADGKLFSTLAKYIKVQYYNAETKAWQKTMPKDQGHVRNYPLPLPFGSNIFKSIDDSGMPAINEYSLRMPWKYQLFNLGFATRSNCIDAIFLNEYAIPLARYLKGAGKHTYVDLLIANQKRPLKTLRNWEQTIDAIYDLVQKPIAHSFFSKYNRIVTKDSSPVLTDGPLAVLTNDFEWESKTWGRGSGKPSVARVQTGTLDKNSYLQDIKQSKGAILHPPTQQKGLDGSSFELDRMAVSMGTALNYDTCIRLQNQCGNKSLGYNIEIIALNIRVPGSHVTNRPKVNIYEVWKEAFRKGLFTVRDPFASDSCLYPEVYQESSPILKPFETKSEKAIWSKPPWINYDPENGVYGWEAEDPETWHATLRLSYLPTDCEQVKLSLSYPEYNEYIFEHFHNVLHKTK